MRKTLLALLGVVAVFFGVVAPVTQAYATTPTPATVTYSINVATPDILAATQTAGLHLRLVTSNNSTAQASPCSLVVTGPNSKTTVFKTFGPFTLYTIQTQDVLVGTHMQPGTYYYTASCNDPTKTVTKATGSFVIPAPAPTWTTGTWDPSNGMYGASDLPCADGGLFVLTGNGITDGQVQVSGIWVNMTEKGGGAWQYDYTGALSNDSLVNYRYQGTTANAVFTLSHCNTGSQVSTPPSTPPSVPPTSASASPSSPASSASAPASSASAPVSSASAPASSSSSASSPVSSASHSATSSSSHSASPAVSVTTSNNGGLSAAAPHTGGGGSSSINTIVARGLVAVGLALIGGVVYWSLRRRYAQ